MTYALPENITKVSNLFQWVNSTTDNFWVIVLLLGLFLIVFFGLKNYPTKNAFSSASFVTSIASVLILLAGLTIDGRVLIICLLLSAISVLWLYFDSN